jgi:hypothetical protein
MGPQDYGPISFAEKKGQKALAKQTTVDVEDLRFSEDLFEGLELLVATPAIFLPSLRPDL